MLLYPLKESTRNFDEYVSDLAQYISDYYPDLVPFFSDNSVGQILYEAQAGIASALTIQIERAMQETRLDYAQIRRNLITLAKNNGIRIPNVSASATFVDFTFDVPVEGDSFSKQYLPIIKSGTQVIGGGQVFEVVDDIDFSSNVNSDGIPNRKYIPILDNSQALVRYEITKREILFSGSSRVYRQAITESSDFLEIVLPETDVIRVEQIIVMPSADAPQTPPFSLFFDDRYRWYEVNSLSESNIFTKYGEPDENGFYSGKWTKIDNKFIYDFTPQGFCRITFGNGRGGKNDFSTILPNEKRLNASLNAMLTSNSLGKRVPSNSTIFVRYRVGGGTQSNITANTINGVGFTEISVNGSNQSINNEVARTLRVNNPVPAIGGKNALNTEEIRKLIEYGKPMKDGAVTLADYRYLGRVMGGIFGKAEKLSVRLEDNKVKFDIIGLDPLGKYTDSGNELLKSNLAEYLSNYRMINDFIEISDAKVLNISFEFDILIDGSASDFVLKNEISQVVNALVMDLGGEIGVDIYLGRIFKEINNINGVINLNGFKVYNMVDSTDAKYSQYKSTAMQTTLVSKNGNVSKYELNVTDNILVSNRDEIFEVKDLVNDIKLIFKRRQF